MFQLYNRFYLEGFSKEELLDYIEGMEEYYIDNPIRRDLAWLENELEVLRCEIEACDIPDEEIIESLRCKYRFLSQKIPTLKQGEHL